MSNYHDFYREILEQLDFSIIGYKSISETINDYFYEISDSSVLKELAHLDFISYSYAQVSDINTWKLSPMSSEYPFYYKSFSEEKNLLYTLSLYYDFKDFLKPLLGGGASRLIVSEIISKVFNRPTPYRVKIADFKYSSVCYDEQLDVITFKISLQSLLKKESGITLQGLKAKFASDFFDQAADNDLEPRLKRKENTFKIKNRRLMGDLFFEKIFDKKRIETEIERLTNDSKAIVCDNKVNILNGSTDHDDSVLKEWIKVIIGHGFLSIFSDRWIENIPSVTKVDFNNSEEISKKSIGTLIIGYSSVNELDSSERALFRMIADKVSSVVTAQVVKEINEELQSQAIISAVSKVMSRNYSHHIGSHVSRRASFEKVIERLDKDYALSENEIVAITKMQERLERYKDERSEFIAGISENPISQTANLSTDIIAPFVENTLLIDNIAKNEGINYRKNDQGKFLSSLIIRIQFSKALELKKNDQIPFIREDIARLTGQDKYIEQRIYYKSDSTDLPIFDSLSIPYYPFLSYGHKVSFSTKQTTYKDIKINVPGALGRHAFYSIFENYIRNTAKHSYSTEKHNSRPVEIIIKIEPKINKPDELRFIITDNISEANDRLIENLSNRIQQTVLNKEAGMGIADMKICACLLAEKSLTEDNLKGNSVLRVINVDGHIGYELTLTKPKEVIVIGFGDRKKNINEYHGVFYAPTISDYLRNNKGNFQFGIVHIDQFDIHSLDKVRHILPFRLIIVDPDRTEKYSSVTCSVKQYPLDCDPEELKKWCWKAWLKHKVKDKKVYFGLTLQEYQDEEVTSNWIQANQATKNLGLPFTSNIFHKESEQQIDLKEFDEILLFDRHAALVGPEKPFFETQFSGTNFWELLDKNSKDFGPIQYHDIENDQNFIGKLVDASRTRILIVDERVAVTMHQSVTNDQQNMLDMDGGFSKSIAVTHHFDAWWASNVFIATHINGKPVSPVINTYETFEDRFHLDIQFKGKGQFLKVRSNLYEDPRELHLGDFDIILIHRTILKNCIKLLSSSENFAKKRERFFRSMIKSKVFVVTGGGVVDFLDEQNPVNILPSSILHELIIDNQPSKLLITDLLR